MKTILNKYFDFTRSELNGLLILVLLIIMITVLPSLYSFFRSETTISDEDRAALTSLLLTKDLLANYRPIRKTTYNEPAKPGVMFVFDPNTTDLDGWQKLGLSAKQAQAIINYRNKGGHFYKPADLQKMYTIKPALYKQMLPYINIAEKPAQVFEKVFSKDKPYKKSALAIIDINIADTLQLDEIKGIGATFAKRIAVYRDRLGGFYKKEQLMEIYGLDSNKYQEIKDQIKIEAGIRKVNINTATFDELKNHPYLRFKQINSIIQYRKQHGNFSGIADLRKIIVLNEETIQKITPYLTF